MKKINVGIIKFFFIVTFMLLSGICFYAKGQTVNTKIYRMSFQYRNQSGLLKDTMISRMLYHSWSESSNYPTYVKWKKLPFAIVKSPINGVGLFTDSSTTFNAGDIIGYAFYKVAHAGSFETDYLESNIGSFVNDSSSPNIDIVLTSDGIIMKAKQKILPNTELTGSYQQLINLFPGDASAEKLIKYWK
jgi:hypothetical protein